MSEPNSGLARPTQEEWEQFVSTAPSLAPAVPMELPMELQIGYLPGLKLAALPQPQQVQAGERMDAYLGVVAGYHWVAVERQEGRAGSYRAGEMEVGRLVQEG